MNNHNLSNDELRAQMDREARISEAEALNLAELQIEAIRGVLEELLTTSGTPDPRTWGPTLLGELGRILDMTALEVMEILADQEERRSAND